MKTLFCLITACLLVFPSLKPAAAADLTPGEVAARLQQTYDRTTTLTADFEQLTSMRMQSRQRRGAGTMALSKPGRIRWDYLSPDRQVLVSDGTTVSMYFEKNRQMMVMPAQRYLNSDVTYAFFVGTGKILKDFEVREPTVAPFLAAGQYCIKLVPRKSHPQLDHLHLWIDATSWLVRRIQLVDQVDSVTDIFFSNLAVNRAIPAGLFKFTPPPGTEVIEQ
ncbi:MAG: outer membrane lipoprotein carrier protein LolA [Desulfobulbaceae bacterium]|nr:outer membrane lipoprotein carrier protein LolA [Desulfobulbaceae bacterium]